MQRLWSVTHDSHNFTKPCFGVLSGNGEALQPRRGFVAFWGLLLNRPYLPFYPGDWRRDAVSSLSTHARCIWFESLLMMHDSEEYGVLVQGGKPTPETVMAARCGVSLADYRLAMQELEDAGVPSRRADGAIYSRKMVRDEAGRVADAERKRTSGRIPPESKRNLSGISPESSRKKGGIEDEDEIEDVLSSGDGIGKGSASVGAIHAEASRRIKPAAPEFPPELDTPEFREAWADYVKFRAEQKHKALGDTAVRQKFKQLAGWGADRAVAALRHSMANGWQGIFEEQSNGSGGNGKYSGKARVSGWERREANAAREFPEDIKLPIA